MLKKQSANIIPLTQTARPTKRLPPLDPVANKIKPTDIERLSLMNLRDFIETLESGKYSQAEVLTLKRKLTKLGSADIYRLAGNISPYPSRLAKQIVKEIQKIRSEINNTNPAPPPPGQ